MNLCEALQQSFNVQARQALLANWRGFIISEVQDRLRNVYKFYQTEITKYQDSELQKLLTKIDYMFANFMCQNVLHNTIQTWI